MRVLSFVMVFAWSFLSFAVGASPVAAQVYGVVSPSSRTAAQSGAAVTLSGWVLSAGQTVTIAAVDQTKGTAQTIATTVASTSGKTFTGYTLYPWSYTTAGPLATNYWAPQFTFDAAGVPTSQGHLELIVSAGGATLPTFSADALSALQQSPLYATDPDAVGPQFSDGNTTVLFDQFGVGGAPASWTTVAGTIVTPPSPPSPVCPPSSPPNAQCNSPYPDVAWSVGSYAAGAASTTIYAMICAPTKPGIYPLVVYNHGGINYGAAGDIGSLHGNLTSAGWTSAPASGADDLGQCVDWAKRGWIFAMSSYRAESINITLDNQAYGTWSSPSTKADGSSEFCMGEVTDVMALVDLLVHRIDTIPLGNPNNPSGLIHITTTWSQSNPTVSWNGDLFMYGYSHGGCITYRAVEQGAPVKAFAVIEGFTDLSLTYLNHLAGCTAGPMACASQAAAASGAVDTTGQARYYPDTSGVMGYNWRSAHYFASRGDLGIRKFKTMPILILHGDNDAANPVPINEPVAFAPDIGATSIYYGPNIALTPRLCIASTVVVGQAIVDPTSHQPMPGVESSCAISFATTLGAADPCLGTNTASFGATPCTVISLPLSPQQQQNLVVYRNMGHFNGGLAIKTQFDRFAEQNFRRKPGCDGVPTGTGPIACNGYY